MLDLSTLDPSVHHEHLRDLILRNDPEPPRCDNPEHGSPSRFRNVCTACGTYERWNQRVNRRFREHGIKRNPRPELDLSGVDPSLHEEHIRDFILRNDPEPARCDNPEHGNPERFRGVCTTCATYARWCQRVNRRFSEHGIKRNPQPADDPKPSCRHGHINIREHQKTCTDCKAIANWRARDYNRKERAGIPRRFTDMPRLREHVDALEAAGMVIPDIAAAATVSEDMLRDLRNTDRTFTRQDIAERVLAVPVPQRRYQLVRNASGHLRRQVDATGTKRRIRCAQNALHSVGDQADRLGWNEKTIRNWLRASTVSIDAADAVATLYPELLARPGTCDNARIAVRQYPWANARYFDETNIDDPAYDPFRIITKPYGMYRRLRAMAYIGQGPAQVAARIGETPEMVELWMEGGPAPAYAHHLVAADYERWCSTIGPDRAAAARAKLANWGSPLAWDDLDMDQRTAHPAFNKLKGFPADQMSVTSIIFDAYDGRVTRFDLRHDELVEVVWILHREGWSDRRIAAWLRWNEDGDHDKGEKAVDKFRERNNISGFGASPSKAVWESRAGLIVTPPGAYRAEVQLEGAA